MITKTPGFLRSFFPNRLWKMNGRKKDLFLTFDDGPVPVVTSWVLEQLKQYNAKATFFCIGENVQKNPEIFKNLIQEGHTIGNHTHNHLNGWKTSAKMYAENILQAEDAISEYYTEKKTRLFRPPYGRMTGKQAQLLLKENYKIVMWDILSRDYDQQISPESCYQNIIKNSEAGSIVVFHDSLKAEKNLRIVLPKVLEHFSGKGYSFKGLEF